jgi:hypothetical protein
VGAEYTSKDLEWCSTGLPTPDASTAKDPKFHCHWVLRFRKGKVDVVQSDYGYTDSFDCTGSTIKLGQGDSGSYDPSSKMLTIGWQLGNQPVQYVLGTADGGQ